MKNKDKSNRQNNKSKPDYTNRKFIGAIENGLKTPKVTRKEIFNVLENGRKNIE